MKKIFEAIRENPLFGGINSAEFEKMINCIDARRQKYRKDEIVIMPGDTVRSVGLIISGGIRILKEDINGGMTIITELSRPDLFGEAFACAGLGEESGVRNSLVTVVASEDSELLLINYKKIINICSSSCSFHKRLIENMLKLIARKNIILNQKIDILSRRTTREKILLFFDMQRGTSKKFKIPYKREEMARYLCVDRSALSNELGKMRDEGLIAFRKNEFEIL